MEEEKRLKALMDIEKTNSSRKTDLIAAKRAENNRKAAKLEYRRQLKRKEVEEYDKRSRELLMHKHALITLPHEINHQ